MNNVTISLGGVGVKVNLDNVTKYDVFIFWRRPLSKKLSNFLALTEDCVCLSVIVIFSN